jgi:photosystem II stability/assembly factor-like uncharacterized protein
MSKSKLFERGGPGRLPALLLALVLGGGASCESCSSGGGGGGGGSSSGGGWLVGESALMINIDHDRLGEVGRYDLDLKDDLLGIACRGTREAWVVGASGLLIATADAGGSWTVLDPGVKATLRAVALAAPNTVLVAGDDGVARISPDGGKHWRSLATPNLSWTSAALRKTDGQVALLASASGALYRWEAASGVLTEVAQAPAALRSVVFSRDGASAAAVGDGGAMLVSTDGGKTWTTRATGTELALRDVWLIGPTGDQFVAVGDGGVVLQAAVRGGDVVSRSLGVDISLRALHMQANGHGMIVGDRGAAFYTENYGGDWRRVDTGENRNIFGVDALDFGSEHF